jgi:hypothetical protein
LVASDKKHKEPLLANRFALIQRPPANSGNGT